MSNMHDEVLVSRDEQDSPAVDTSGGDINPIGPTTVTIKWDRSKDFVTRSKVNVPTFSYIHGNYNSSRGADSGSFRPLEYNLREIDAAEDVDSYIFQANLKKLALAVKEGFSIAGRNKKTSEYIKKRFKQIEFAQDRTMLSLYAELLGNLFRYHMAVIVKSRSVEASGGKIRRDGKALISPVAGYFSASPATMEVKLGKNRKIIKWRHKMPDGRTRELSPRDVVTFTLNKRSHFIAPTPPWWPVLDDVAALRRIEEHIENLIYQHIFPLFIYTVGTVDKPALKYPDGTNEVDLVKAEINSMPTDGMLVVPARHSIKALGAESRALRAEVYVEAFRKRIIAGSGLSAVDFGDGNTANRATAETMSKLAIGNVKFAQKMFFEQVNFDMIRELLLEGGFPFDPMDEKHIVWIEPNEVDIEAQIKKENHLMLLYAGGLITRTEARTESGREALTKGQEEDLISAHQAETQSQAAALAAATNKQQPTNQHGTNSGPEKKKSALGEKVIRLSELLRRGSLSTLDFMLYLDNLGTELDKREAERLVEIGLWVIDSVNTASHSVLESRLRGILSDLNKGGEFYNAKHCD